MTLDLTKDELALILDGLSMLPLRQSYNLFNKIVQEHDKPITPPTPPLPSLHTDDRAVPDEARTAATTASFGRRTRGGKGPAEPAVLAGVEAAPRPKAKSHPPAARASQGGPINPNDDDDEF